MTLLPDGSEKGLLGYAEERGARRRVGLAPPAGTVDRNAPYKRIATEEAWTFPELVKAQVDYMNAHDAPEDDSLRMAGMFGAMPKLQGMLQDIGEGRLAHMDEYGIDRQLLLLTSPGVQVVRESEGTALARRQMTAPRKVAVAGPTATQHSPPSIRATWRGQSRKSTAR
jgi:hypothetical protein